MDTIAVEVTEVRRSRKSGAMLGLGFRDDRWIVFERANESETWRPVAGVDPCVSSGQARNWIKTATLR